ncbi:2-succinyl-6-hydroxy-2,4-cyclohexadiene-1-carboxylate synthase [candidate division GN15 bacterium]|nr:2-succinyl-6-hydroxy-2,4-cyclohexadiene-1-carboxylate synthase [candidate division GN15 bacterium]
MATMLLSHRFRGQPGKPVLLFLHGFIGRGDDWDSIAGNFEDDYAILTVDLPGHGGSYPLADSDPAHFSMSGCGSLLTGLIDHYEINTCHVIGYSMGARLALYLATHHADRFRRFVIESGSPGLRTESEREERRRRDAELAKGLKATPMEEFLKQWYSQPLFSSLDQRSDTFREMLRRRLEINSDGLALSLEHMGTGAQPPLWDRLPQVDPKVLFIAGELDRKFYRLAAEMAHLCPNGELAIIAGAGHNVHVEQPELYREQLLSFLTTE